MVGYLIAHIIVNDPEGFGAYREQVPGVVAHFGGRYLVRGGAMRGVEGDMFRERLTVIAFDSLAAAEAFYGSDAYAPLKQLRIDTTKSDVAIVAGLD